MYSGILGAGWISCSCWMFWWIWSRMADSVEDGRPERLSKLRIILPAWNRARSVCERMNDMPNMVSPRSFSSISEMIFSNSEFESSRILKLTYLVRKMAWTSSRESFDFRFGWKNDLILPSNIGPLCQKRQVLMINGLFVPVHGNGYGLLFIDIWSGCQLVKNVIKKFLMLPSLTSKSNHAIDMSSWSTLGMLFPAG